tara:strand:- start:454 stop:2103 length:1650 start_codon:yes stop_codon:yes gene_type:complete
MAKILKQRQEAGPLEKLVSDLPELLIGLYGMQEQYALEREKMQNQEEMALIELSLQNLAMSSDKYKNEISTYEDEIRTIQQEFQDTTTFLPDTSDINGTSDNTALNVLNQLEDAVSEPMYDLIKERAEIIVDDSEYASQLNNQRNRLKQDQNALRYLKGNMAQNLATVASQGGDPYMVDAGDLEPYWESTLLPAMKSQGLIPGADGQFDTETIERYKSIWSGMLAPQTTRYAQRESIIKNRESVIKQGIEEQNIMDIAWDTLPKDQKDILLGERSAKLGAVVGPQINRMAAGTAGKVGQYSTLLAQTGAADDDYISNMSPTNFDNWDDDTQVAWMTLQKEYQQIGALLLNTKASQQILVNNRPEIATIDNSFNPKEGTWADPMIQRQVTQGKAFIDAFNAISKPQDQATEVLFMEQLKLAQQFLTVRVNQASGKPVLNSQGEPVLIDYDDPKNQRRKTAVLRLFGLSPGDYDNQIMDAILEQYQWIEDKTKSGILGLFNDLDPSSKANNINSQIPIEELYAYKGTTQEEEILDNTVVEALALAENEWIV